MLDRILLLTEVGTRFGYQGDACRARLDGGHLGIVLVAHQRNGPESLQNGPQGTRKQRVFGFEVEGPGKQVNQNGRPGSWGDWPPEVARLPWG